MKDRTAKYAFYMKDGQTVIYEGMVPSTLFEKDRGTITIMRKDRKKFATIMLNEVNWYTWEYEVSE